MSSQTLILNIPPEIYARTTRKSHQKASDIEILQAYKQTPNVWKVAELFGMCGQSVHIRLTKLNAIQSDYFTDSELSIIKEVYKQGFVRGDNKLNDLCKRLGRNKHTIARAARRMGLTSYNRKTSESSKIKMGALRKQWLKENEHPRGALGMKHSIETLLKISNKSKEYWKNISPADRKKRREAFIASMKKSGGWRKGENIYSRTKSGKRKDLNNQFFRSGTEANFARYLTHIVKIEYKYESREFIFDDIRRGVIGYTPDFYIPSQDIYYEVKGWLDPKSITRIKRFKKRYPAEFVKLYIVKETLSKKDLGTLINKIGFKKHQVIDFKSISNYRVLVPGWEGK